MVDPNIITTVATVTGVSGLGSGLAVKFIYDYIRDRKTLVTKEGCDAKQKACPLNLEFVSFKVLMTEKMDQMGKAQETHSTELKENSGQTQELKNEISKLVTWVKRRKVVIP